MDNSNRKKLPFITCNQPRVVNDDDSRDSEGTGEVLDYPGLTVMETESRRIGVAGAMFLILNKMIGTGSRAPCIHAD